MPRPAEAESWQKLIVPSAPTGPVGRSCLAVSADGLFEMPDVPLEQVSDLQRCSCRSPVCSRLYMSEKL